MITLIFKEGVTMVSIIAGEKGKGKTKILLEKANEAVSKGKRFGHLS